MLRPIWGSKPVNKTDASMGLLDVKNLTAFYGNVKALDGVDFSVGEKEIVTLIGANGAGKTTILRSISGLIASVSGQIEFEEEPILSMKPAKIVTKGLIHVPEGRRLFPRMSVRENLELGSFRLSKKDLASEPLEVGLEKVFDLFPRLKERITQLAGTLSGGEQQMVAIGRGLMARPKLLLLDEPSMGLAPQLVQTVFEAIEKINQDGIAVLLVEQNAFQALQIADRAYVLETGNVLFSGPGKELLEDPRVRSAYLGES